MQKGHLFKKLRKSKKTFTFFLLIVKIKSLGGTKTDLFFVKFQVLSLYLIAHPWVVHLARNTHINHQSTIGLSMRLISVNCS